LTLSVLTGYIHSALPADGRGDAPHNALAGAPSGSK
jgi:hypothetical protein